MNMANPLQQAGVQCTALLSSGTDVALACRHLEAVLWAVVDGARSALELKPLGDTLEGRLFAARNDHSALAALAADCARPLLLASGALELAARFAVVGLA